MKNIFLLVTFTHILLAQNSTYNYDNNHKAKTNNKLFYVQIGAFTNKSYALKTIKELREFPYPLRLREKYIDTRKYYKLLVGPFSSYEKAKDVILNIPNKDGKAFVYEDYLF